MSDLVFTLPELVSLSSFKGVFNDYLEAVYCIFRKDFIESRPIFRGTRLGLKKLPLSEGKEATFWHFISEGKDENSRNADITRMERIRWPKPIINSSENSYFKVWENTRGTKKRILIWHDAEQYLVVLADRGKYILPWTAYKVTEGNRKRKLMKEYEEYLKAKTAQ